MGRAFLAVVLVLTTGCATVTGGRDFDLEAFHKLTPGTSTTADVLALVGEPWLRQVLPDGSEQWVYLSSKSEAVAVPFYVHSTGGQTKTMTLQFRDGVLVKPSGIGREFDPAIFRTFTPGTTTADEVRAAVGEPWVRNVLPDGSELWTYVSVKAGGQTQTMTLQFSNGVLVRPPAPAK